MMFNKKGTDKTDREDIERRLEEGNVTLEEVGVWIKQGKIAPEEIPALGFLMMDELDQIKSTLRAEKDKVTVPIFNELFSDKKYLLQLYRDLHPEDEKVTADDITDVIHEHHEHKIDSKLNKLYNYLGFKVGSRLLLVFTLPGWIELNHVGNCALKFMPDSIKRLMESSRRDMSGNETSELFMPELYMVYTDRIPDEVPETLSLSDEHFTGRKIPVLSQPDDKTIIGQYIYFWREFDEQIYRYGYSMEAIKNTFDECKKNDILTEFIANREQEVTEIIFDSFDPEDIAEAKFIQEEMEAYEKELIEEGKLKAAREAAEKMIKDNLPLENIEKWTKLSMDELKQIEAKVKANGENE